MRVAAGATVARDIVAEADIAELGEADSGSVLAEFGVQQTALDQVARHALRLLNLSTCDARRSCATAMLTTRARTQLLHGRPARGALVAL